MNEHDGRLPDDDCGSITVLFQQWRKGENAAMGDLFARFRPRLLALARKTLSGRIPRSADAEDALQSAMISFWECVAGGGLNNSLDRDDLWNVLGLITVRKAIKLQTKEGTQKRGGGRIVDGAAIEYSAAGDSGGGLDVLCSEMLEMLEEDLRTFALLRLMGYKNREIADKLGCSERKVERKLELIRAVWDEEVSHWHA